MILSEICIKRPVFAIVLSLILLTMGGISYTKLQVRALPDIDQPVIVINSQYAGADAEYMEKEVTTKIEQALKSVKNIDNITSRSLVGLSEIIIIFKLSANMDASLNEVRSKISDIGNTLPQDMRAPSISKASLDNTPSMWIRISSDKLSNLELTRIIKEYLQKSLEKLDSVATAQIYGESACILATELNPLKMLQYKLSASDVETAIKLQNKNHPAGIIKTIDKEFVVRLNSAPIAVEDFANITLANQGKNIIKLKDIANVSLTSDEEKTVLKYNGDKAVALGLIKQSKANILDLSMEVRSTIEKERKNLPESVSIDIVFDASTTINASVRAVFITIIETLVLVILVTYLFLASAKAAIIPAITIPISLIATFSVMHILGFSINSFTLLAIILAIGLVVDDAIVMVENIVRHQKHEKNPIIATQNSCKEVSFAIIAMTITLSAVFLPVGFIDGFLGRLFIEFAWTLAFCVLFSGFVALTLTPMMASRLLNNSTNHATIPQFLQHFTRFIELIQAKYIYYLERILNNKKRFLQFTASSILVLIMSLIFVNKTFMPGEDEGFLQINFTGPEGASLKRSEKTVEQVEKTLETYKDIDGYLTVAGLGGSNKAFALVLLKDWSERTRSQNKIKNLLNLKLSTIPDMSISVSSLDFGGNSSSFSDVQFNIASSLNYTQLSAITEEFIKRLKTSQVFMNTVHGYSTATPTLDILINHEKALLYDLDTQSIGGIIGYFISGKQVGHFQLGGDTYDIMLRYKKNGQNEINDIKQIFVRNKENALIPLQAVAKIEAKSMADAYEHYNGLKAIKISSNLNNNYKITDAIEIINQIAEELIDKTTTKLEYLGVIQNMEASDNTTMTTFMFAILFIYLVLAVQFESFTDPLIILLSVPFSITGGVLALLLFNNSINMYSNIGLITLIGLITKNAIMIVEFANQLKLQGYSTKDAITKAASLRLRPIMMTTGATIAGAIPLALAAGAGSAARNSIGLVIIGGMLVGTIFTLFVIPVLYQIFKSRNSRVTD